MKKRVLSLFLALGLCLATMTVPASAYEFFRQEDGSIGIKLDADEYQRYLDGELVPKMGPEDFHLLLPTDTPAPTSTDTPADDDTPVTAPKPVPTPAAITDSRFTDVPADAWYAEAVNALAEGGLVQGVGDGKFAPDKTVTYAELLTILDRLFGNTSVHAQKATGRMSSNQYGKRTVKMYVDGLGWFHWAAPAYDAVLSALQGVRSVVHPEDLNCNVPRAHAISLMTATYERSENHNGYVHAYTEADIPDWDLVKGIQIPNWDAPVYCIGDKLNFLPDQFIHGKNPWSTEATGYNMEQVDRVAQEMIDAGHPELAYKPLVFAKPDLVLKAYNYGLVQGIDENLTCGALNTLTRAELCQMLYNAGLTHEDMCTPDAMP